MDYQGPQAADLADVHSLNTAFLACLHSPGTAAGLLLRRMSPALVERFAALNVRQLARLARTPFMLLSFREHDDEFWDGLLRRDVSRDLLAPLERPSDDIAQLTAAGMGFLWQLSKRNPYTARLLGGASLYWCERIATRTLMELLLRVIPCNHLLEPRLADNGDFWSKLLSAGVSPEREVRVAARLCALQTMLTQSPAAIYRRLPAAACNMPMPALRVAEKPERLRGAKES